MQKAAFSIVKYQFDKVSIDLENHISSELSLDFTTSGIFETDESIFELTFFVRAFNDGKEDFPFVNVKCKGIFKFEEKISFEEIPSYFYRNSIAILFPFVRSYVSIVTTQANVPGIMLPTLNLSSLEDILKTNTTSK